MGTRMRDQSGSVSVFPDAGSYIWKYYPPIGNTDTLPLWSRIRVPILVLYGERDAIEDVRQYALRADEKLRAAKNGDYTLVVLPRALHELKVDPEPNAKFHWRVPSP